MISGRVTALGDRRKYIRHHVTPAMVGSRTPNPGGMASPRCIVVTPRTGTYPIVTAMASSANSLPSPSPSTRASCSSASAEITCTTIASNTFARRELRRGCQGKEGERPTGNLPGPGRFPPNSSILEGERAVVTVTDANRPATTLRSLPVTGGDHQARSPEHLTPGDGLVSETIMISIRTTTPIGGPAVVGQIQ